MIFPSPGVWLFPTTGISLPAVKLPAVLHLLTAAAPDLPARVYGRETFFKISSFNTNNIEPSALPTFL